MTILNQTIEKILNHESIQYADSQIAFNAVRTGTQGYTGEKLEVALERELSFLLSTYRSSLEKRIEIIVPKVPELESDDFDEGRKSMKDEIVQLIKTLREEE